MAYGHNSCLVQPGLNAGIEPEHAHQFSTSEWESNPRPIIGLHSTIRTCDPLRPKQVLSQAELYGDGSLEPTLHRLTVFCLINWLLKNISLILPISYARGLLVLKVFKGNLVQSYYNGFEQDLLFID